MNYYEIWCNLKNNKDDMPFAKAVDGYLGMLLADKRIASFQIRRRKLGLGPLELGEFNVTVAVRNLAQLDSAYTAAVARSGELERRHESVFSLTKDFRAALYRDFPDSQRSDLSTSAVDSSEQKGTTHHYPERRTPDGANVDLP